MEKLLIGKIIKPQGVKGECKIYPLTNDLSLFDNIKEVYLDNQVYKVESLVVRFGFAYMKVESIIDRNMAEKLRNKKVYIAKDNASLKEDEYFIDDIIGFEVVDEYNDSVGKLINVEQFGAADVFVIYANKREYRVPFIADIVKKVDLINHTIIVDKKNYNEAKICE